MRNSDNKTRASVYLDDARAAEIRDVKVVPMEEILDQFNSSGEMTRNEPVPFNSFDTL